MDVSNLNNDKFGEHINGKGKRFTLFVFSNYTEFVEFSQNFLQVY